MSIVCNSDNFFRICKGHKKNMFNLDFLHSYYPKLCFQLNQLFDEDETAAECFLHSEYEFTNSEVETELREKPGVFLSWTPFATMKKLNWTS